MNVEFVMSLTGVGQAPPEKQLQTKKTVPAEDGGAAGLAAFSAEPYQVRGSGAQMSTWFEAPGPGVMTASTGGCRDVSDAEAVSLTELWSNVAALTVAVTVWAPSLTAAAKAVMVSVAVAPGASDPIAHVPV